MPSHACIVGAGVLGLSLAYELARRKWRVTVIERQAVGKEASWAGAGILPPANEHTATHPIEKLRGLSHRLHAEWAARLQQETGIDNGFRRCGGIYLARAAGEAAALHGWAAQLREEEIAVERLTSAELSRREPAILAAGHMAAYWTPGECQLRNPRHLVALRVAAERLGATMVEHCEVTSLEPRNGVVGDVQTTRGPVGADVVVVTAGAWTTKLLQDLGKRLEIVPIRGQMVLFRADHPPFSAVVNEGSRYLVARDDGHVLVGSTEEEVGYDKSTTREAREDIVRFAYDLVPSLRNAEIVNHWSGLRPLAYDGFPYVGRIPPYENLYVAAGHFRSGLHLSPATAVLLSDMLEGSPTEVDLSYFRPDR